MNLYLTGLPKRLRSEKILKRSKLHIGERQTFMEEVSSVGYCKSEGKDRNSLSLKKPETTVQCVCIKSQCMPPTFSSRNLHIFDSHQLF